jgi:hypothetical protein
MTWSGRQIIIKLIPGGFIRFEAQVLLYYSAVMGKNDRGEPKPATTPETFAQKFAELFLIKNRPPLQLLLLLDSECSMRTWVYNENLGARSARCPEP